MFVFNKQTGSRWHVIENHLWKKSPLSNRAWHNDHILSELAIFGKFCRRDELSLKVYSARIWKKYMQQNWIRQSSNSIVRFAGWSKKCSQVSRNARAVMIRLIFRQLCWKNCRTSEIQSKSWRVKWRGRRSGVNNFCRFWQVLPSLSNSSNHPYCRNGITKTNPTNWRKGIHRRFERSGISLWLHIRFRVVMF